jgi:putative ABC transport system permease protein
MEIRPIFSALLRSKTGAILVALQVAISLAILSNALHIVHVRQAVAARPSGLADEASTFYIGVHHLNKGSHNEQLARQQAETAALRAVAGVASVAWTSQMPMSWSGSTTQVTIDRKQVQPTANISFYISPDSLVRTLGLHIVEGRDFVDSDVPTIDTATTGTDAAPHTALVTRALAERMFPGAASVVGRTFYLGDGQNATQTRVIGVMDMLQGHNADLGPEGYMALISPARLTNAFDSSYAVRAEPGQRDRVMREAAAALRKTTVSPVVLESRTVDQDRQRRYRGDRALAWMLVAVSVLLLLITASGIVGMASLWVNQRRKQIGVRRALGAKRIDILRYFLTENLIITSLGVLAGALLALALNHFLVARLGMARLPLGYLATGAAVFWALGAGAAYGPAWRAASISPATATRTA